VRRSPRAGDRRLRADRAAVGLRRHGDALPRGARPTTALRHQRQEELDHLRPGREVHRAVRDDRPGRRGAGITAFLVDTDREGFHRGKTEPKLGIRASATCEIEFTDYVVPAEDVLGKEGEGFKIAMGVLDAGRIGIASQAVGIARAAYEATLAYVRERKAFGQPIGSFQMIQAKIADMKCKLDAARLLTLRAAWNKEGRRTAALHHRGLGAKLFASEAAMFIAHQAVQIHGGMGYSKEMPLERYFRDAKITEIYEGTSEIQRLVIARQETGLSFASRRRPAACPRDACR
jgi:alkylation response protein AidB-like acyl-CoA dehydrogenase